MNSAAARLPREYETLAFQAMGKENFDNWLNRTVTAQTRIAIGACVGMACVSLVLLLIHGGLLFLTVSAIYGSMLLGALACIVFFGATGAYVSITAPRILNDSIHEVDLDPGHCEIRIAPTIAVCWTYAMGSLETDRSIPERILSLFLMVPRCCWTSWYLYQRIADIRQLNQESCSRVLRMLLKRAEAVRVQEIAAEFPGMEIPATLRDISLIDGVVFLTKRGVSLSLAKRFMDALEKDLYGESVTPKASVFDGD